MEDSLRTRAVLASAGTALFLSLRNGGIQVRRNEELIYVKKELSLHGIDAKVQSGGKHIKITWQHNGQSRLFVVAVTGSDVRGRKNARADLRRLLRRDGVLPLVNPRRAQYV